MATNTWMEPVFIRWSEKRGDGTKAPSKRTIVRSPRSNGDVRLDYWRYRDPHRTANAERCMQGIITLRVRNVFQRRRHMDPLPV
jgi:hypothetical protein